MLPPSHLTKGQHQAQDNLVLSACQTAQMAEIKPPHDPHGKATDMYTPSLLVRLGLKWDEETDKGLAWNGLISLQP